MSEKTLDARALLEGQERFKFVRVLGTGGCAVVVEVIDTTLSVHYALKILTFGPNSRIGQRFRGEVLALRELSSAHLVKSFDFLQIGDYLGLVMELMDGDLENWLREHGALPIGEALRITIAIANALEEAHRAGIVHRDVKPSNVLLRNGLKVIRLGDFGIAQTSGGHQGMTATGAMMGSLPFVAPEQLRDAKSADARADIFSLGKLLFTLLNLDHLETSSEAFPYLVDAGLLTNDNIPAEIAKIILKATRMNRDERYSSMSEILQALQQYQADIADATSVAAEKQVIQVDAVSDPFKDDAITTPPERFDNDEFDEEGPMPVYEERPRRPPVALAILVGGALIALTVLIFGIRTFWPSSQELPVVAIEAPEAEPELVVVNTRPDKPIEVLEPSPATLAVETVPEPAISEVKTEEPKPEPVKATPVAETVTVKASKPKLATTKAPEPPKPKPVEVVPDPPAPTTGKVTISGDFLSARLSGRPATRANELAPGKYELEVEFGKGEGFATIRTVEVKAGDDIKLTCKDFDCR